MKPKDKTLFCTLLTSVAELYGKPIYPNALEIYWNALEKYSLADIRRAVSIHVINQDNGQFMPKPADLVRYLEASNSAKALHAWDKVVLAMRTIGSYSSITFDDPTINVIINEMGGWVSMCRGKKDKLPFVAIEFQRRYSAYLIYPLPEAPKYLCGFTEQQNRFCQYYDHIPKPVLFGEKETDLMIETFNTPEKDDAK